MDLLTDFVLKRDILRGTIPQEILNEANDMVMFCRRYKNSKLSQLRYLHNIGTNDYQCFIPFNLVNESFMLPYLNLCAKRYHKNFYNSSNKDVKIGIKDYNDILTYDIWINYCKLGDENKKHWHAFSNYAGIIFIKNDNELTYFENDEEVNGKEGDIIIFPATLSHWTKPQRSKKERVTISFNFVVFET